MNYTITQKNIYSILYIQEEKLMAEEAMKAKNNFIDLLQEKDLSDHWIVDLSSLKYIDSAGLGAFLTLYRLMRNTGRTLYFIGIQKYVQKLLSIAKLDHTFQIYDSLESVEDLIQKSNNHKS